MELKNYKLKDFIKQDEDLVYEYTAHLKHLPTSPKIKRLFSKTLGEVEEIKTSYTNGLGGLVKSIGILQGIKENQVMNLNIKDFYGLVNGLNEQIEKLYMAEQSLQSRHENVKWIAVGGGKKMAKYGIYNTLDQLADGDILKFRQILELPYEDVFTKLKMDIEKADLQLDMDSIKTI